MQYKHYSFDLWQTLIKSNIEYKKQRANYFFKHFNRKGLCEEDVFIVIRDIEKMVDSVNQTTGLNIECVEIVSMILYQLGYDIYGLSINDMVAIVHMMQQKFMDCPPVLYDKDTYGVLSYLHSEGATISILSNTAFIIGDTLDRALAALGISKFISFSLYSDQQGISKPNPMMFFRMIGMCKVDFSEIIHIGDNPIADIQGAKSIGLSSMQINTVEKTIKNIPV